MNAYEIAKNTGKDSVFSMILQAGLCEYGIYGENLSEKLLRILQENDGLEHPVRVAGALNNEDTDYMLFSVLKEHPEKVIYGLAVEAFLMDAEEMILYIPNAEKEWKAKLTPLIKNTGLPIYVEIGRADTRKLSGACISHLETLARLSDVLEGNYIPGVTIAVKRKSKESESFEKPVFVPFGSTWDGVLNEAVKNDMDSIKAVQIGTKLYDASVFSQRITKDINFGNGVVTIYDKSCCMMDEAERILLKDLKEGCGKCTFCREGLYQLYTRFHEITAGKGDWSSLEIMKEIAQAMQFSSFCSMGQTGGSIVLETLRLFEKEYEEHIKKKHCSSGVCKAFINVYISPDLCDGCGLCRPVCPMDCIEGMTGYIHMLEDIDCTKCGKCVEVCEKKAIVRTTQKVPRLPDRLTRTGRFKRY